MFNLNSWLDSGKYHGLNQKCVETDVAPTFLAESEAVHVEAHVIWSVDCFVKHSNSHDPLLLPVIVMEGPVTVQIKRCVVGLPDLCCNSLSLSLFLIFTLILAHPSNPLLSQRCLTRTLRDAKG